MPCNPSIGGSAKGIIVREIDALGGEMGINADKSLLQMKMLNRSKGPAVHSLRAQADKITYPKNMRETLKKQKNLTLLEGMVEDLIVKNKEVSGIILKDGTKITSKIVILTTGTYLKADILRGSTRTRSGPNGEKPSMHLSDKLKSYGFNILRLKTGTPQRIDKSSIDFTKTKKEDGDSTYYTFSHDLEKPLYDVNNQIPCHLIYTTDETKKIIDAAIKYDVYLEVNANGIKNTFRDLPEYTNYLYPREEFWEIVKNSDATIVIGADAHEPSALGNDIVKKAIEFTEKLNLNIHDFVKLK